jgi:hypothetical protein
VEEKEIKEAQTQKEKDESALQYAISLVFV